MFFFSKKTILIPTISCKLKNCHVRFVDTYQIYTYNFMKIGQAVFEESSMTKTVTRECYLYKIIIFMRLE